MDLARCLSLGLLELVDPRLVLPGLGARLLQLGVGGRELGLGQLESCLRSGELLGQLVPRAGELVGDLPRGALLLGELGARFVPLSTSVAGSALGLGLGAARLLEGELGLGQGPREALGVVLRRLFVGRPVRLRGAVGEARSDRAEADLVAVLQRVRHEGLEGPPVERGALAGAQVDEVEASLVGLEAGVVVGDPPLGDPHLGAARGPDLVVRPRAQVEDLARELPVEDRELRHSLLPGEL